MARARNIKPGFFANEILAEIEPLGRLLFAGLWSIADRAGRLEDRPKRIRAEVLPYDICDADALLQALHDKGFILRYEVDGVRFIQVLAWEKHQNPHIKEGASAIPEPVKHGTSTVLEQCEEQPLPEQARLIVGCGLLVPDSGFRIPDTGEKNLPAPKTAPVAKAARQPNPEAAEACRQVWAAYSEAYLSRYGAEPVRNAKVNTQVAQLVKNLGTDAAAVAAFFVWHSDAFYVRKGHDIGCAVTDSGKLRTEWVTGNRITAAKAREADQLQTNGDDWSQIKQEHAHGV